MHRRDALKFFSLSAMLAISPIHSIGRIENQVFSSSPFGITLETPPDWHCMLLPEYLGLLKSDYNDENPKVPIFACTRFKEPIETENDTVLLFADRIREAKQLPAQNGDLNLSEENTWSDNYSFTTTTVDGRSLSFNRNFYLFNDGVSRFHLEFEWGENSDDRSRKVFDDIFGSFTLLRPAAAGWG